MKNNIEQLKMFMIWLNYNNWGKADISHDLDSISSTFIKATSVAGKYCICKNKGKCSNRFWDDWHCTYCLKPKSKEK